jgi:rRNA maturation RNase YbeY
VSVALSCETPRARRYASAMRADARILLKLLGLGRFELSLSLIDDSSMRELNRIFRGKDRPTDVLSFPQLEVSTGTSLDGAGSIAKSLSDIESARLGSATPLVTLLGDVVISVETAERQATRLGVAAAARLRTLVIHSVLHLLGYDHEESRAAARRMFARERELAAALAETGAERLRPVRITGRKSSGAASTRRHGRRTAGRHAESLAPSASKIRRAHQRARHR